MTTPLQPPPPLHLVWARRPWPAHTFFHTVVRGAGDGVLGDRSICGRLDRSDADWSWQPALDPPEQGLCCGLCLNTRDKLDAPPGTAA